MQVFKCITQIQCPCWWFKFYLLDLSIHLPHKVLAIHLPHQVFGCCLVLQSETIGSELNHLAFLINFFTLWIRERRKYRMENWLIE